MSSTGRIALAGALLLPLASAACDVATTDHRVQEAALPYPEIGFENQPSYLPSNVVVLTFDDGPDWNNTARVLDVLAQKNAKATFFVNTENWSNVETDGPMQDLVRRMVQEGHELASHSVHHHHMASLSASQIEAELSGVETTIGNVLGPTGPRLTLFRAPFGEPYQGNDPNAPSPGYQLVAPIVAEHAVHIGWAIDSFDYACAGSAQCVFDNIRTKLEAGHYGVILLHSVHAQTADALPQIIDYLRANGYELWTTEDVVQARYGKTSAQLVDGGGPDPGPDPQPDPDPNPDPDPGPGPGDCDVPAYTPGASYGPGDRVQAGGSVYECKPWPYSGWCSAGGAYAPGSGWAWAEAWNLVGACDGGGGGGDPGGGGGGGGDGDGWRQANLTWFTSYPDPGSDECEQFNGCQWAGYFAFLDGQQSPEWVAANNIAAVHSKDADEYRLKTLRIRQGDRQIDVKVYDYCSDSDCGGCCTANSSETGFLIDIEEHTMERFGTGWGVVEWTCLDCN